VDALLIAPVKRTSSNSSPCNNSNPIPAHFQDAMRVSVDGHIVTNDTDLQSQLRCATSTAESACLLPLPADRGGISEAYPGAEEHCGSVGNA